MRATAYGNMIRQFTERFPMHARWPDMLPKIEQMVRDADAGTRNVREALSTLDAELEAVTRSA